MALLSYLVWFLLAALYAPLFYWFYSSVWYAMDYTHAYFILPVSLWLAWRKRAALRELAEQPRWGNGVISFALLVVGTVMFTFGWRQDFGSISRLSIVPVLAGATCFLYGTRTLRVLAFPILYLLFLVPASPDALDTITLPMRYGASAIAGAVLKSLSYPVVREGLLLSIGGNEIFMGQPCSGFRSLITMLSLTAVYGYLTQPNIGRGVILALSAIPLALIANVIRVVTVCLIAFYFGQSAADGFFHYFSGALIFVLTILGILCLEAVIEKLDVRGGSLP